MKLYIKNMVSLRCKLMIKEELRKLDLHYTTVELGMVEIIENTTLEQYDTLKKNLSEMGLELMDDNRSILNEKIVNVIVEMIHYSEELPEIKYSEYISHKMGYCYTYLANTFIKVKGMTIRQFIINHKIEKVKEMLLYDELSLTEISYRLKYSSVSHLSNQFKKTTGFSPSYYKQIKQMRTCNLENI